jgi:hypothetical protein
MIWNFVKEKNFVGQILVFVLLYSSLYSTYLWTGKLTWMDTEVFPLLPPPHEGFYFQWFTGSTGSRCSHRSLHPLTTDSLHSCILFPRALFLPGLIALFNHMVLFLRVFGSRPLSAQLHLGGTKRAVLKADRERSEVCPRTHYWNLTELKNWLRFT